MKHFNFLNQENSQAQHDFKKWARYSLIFFSFLLLFLGFITISKIVKLKKVKKEISNLKNISGVQEQTILNSQMQNQQDIELEKRVKKLSKWKNPQIIPITVLSDISSVIPDDVMITEINYKFKQPINIKGQTKNLMGVKNFVQKLKEIEWASKAQLLKLESTQKDNLSNFEIVIK